jgi:hypothetical protein
MNWYLTSQALKWTFVTTCTQEPNAYLVDYIVDKSEDIDWETFYDNIPNPEQYIFTGQGSPIPLREDWSVSFASSKMPSGIPVLYFVHSLVEHFFIPTEAMGRFDIDSERNAAYNFED